MENHDMGVDIGFRLNFLICVFIIITGMAIGAFLLPKR